MADNLGKKFEELVKKSFEHISDISIDRLHDQTTGFAGSANICDFIVYRHPFEYYIECKSVHGNTLSIHSNPKPDNNGVMHGFYGNISDRQWNGMLNKTRITGVYAGVICWWVDKDVTRFIPIQELQRLRDSGMKSIRFDTVGKIVDIKGDKKRTYFDYDMYSLFEGIEDL